MTFIDTRNRKGQNLNELATLGIIVLFLFGIAAVAHLVRLLVALWVAFGSLNTLRDESVFLVERLANQIAKSQLGSTLGQVFGSAVYVCSITGECTDSNDSLCELYGRTKEEMLGFGWLNALHPQDRAAAKERWLYAVRYKDIYHAEYRIVRGDETIYCQTRAYRIEQGGIALCYVGIVEPLHDVHGSGREYYGSSDAETDRPNGKFDTPND